MSKQQKKITDFTKLTDKAANELYLTGALFMGKTLEEVIELYIMVNNEENYTLALSNMDQLYKHEKEPLLDKERDMIKAINQLKKAIYKPHTKKDKKTIEKRNSKIFNKTESAF